MSTFERRICPAWTAVVFLLSLAAPALAAGVPRIEISPGSAVLAKEGDTVQLEAEWIGGTIGAEPLIVWSSSDPDQVSVDQNGMATALWNDAFAVIVAESPADFVHQPGYASVMVAGLASGVLHLSVSYVLKVDVVTGDQPGFPHDLETAVEINEETAALEIGDAVSFGDAVSMTIAHISDQKDHFLLLGDLLPLNELFERLHIRMDSQAFETLAGKAAPVRAARKALAEAGGWDCEATLTPSFTVDSIFEFEIDDKKVTKLVFHLDGDFSMSVNSISISASAGCSIELPPVPVWTPIPLLGLTLWPRAVTSVGAEVSLSASVQVETPSASLGLPFFGGLTYSPGFFDVPLNVGQPTTSVDPRLIATPSFELSASGQISFGGGLRISVYPGTLVSDSLALVHIDLAVQTFSLGREYVFPSQALLGPSHPDYASPTLQDFLSWKITPISVEAGGLLEIFLEVLGIEPIPISVSSIEIHRWEIGDSTPEAIVSNDKVYINGGNGLPPSTLVSAQLDPWAHPFEPNPIESLTLWRSAAGGPYAHTWDEQALWTPVPGEEGSYAVRAMAVHSLWGPGFPIASEPVDITVLEAPGILVTPETVRMSAAVGSTTGSTVTVANATQGSVTYGFGVPANFSWLAGNPVGGSFGLAVGESRDHTLTLTCGSEPVEYEGFFEASHGGETFRFDVEASCDLIDMAPNPLRFSIEVDDSETKALTLTNILASTVQWEIQNGGGPTPVPASGSLAPGASAVVSMTTSCSARGRTTWDMPVAISGAAVGNDVLHVGRDCQKKGGSSTGDPHLRSLDDVPFNFQAQGEFIMSRDLEGDFEVQARQTPIGNWNVSINKAVAMNVAGERVAFYVHPPQAGGRVMVNGAAVDIGDGAALVLPGNAGAIERDGVWYTVTWTDTDHEVVVRFLSNALNYHVFPDATVGPQLEGVLGSLDGDPANDFQFRGGQLLGSPPSFDEKYGCDTAPCLAYGSEGWINRDANASLFDYNVGEGPETFAPPVGIYFPAAPISTSDCDPQLLSWAESLCEVIDDPVGRDSCVLDACLTGDAELGLGNGVSPGVSGPPPGDLVGFFRFDGNARDDSGYGHHAYVDGAVLVSDRFGTPARAYRFDGVSDLIQTPIDIDQSSGSPGLTLMAWARPDTSWAPLREQVVSTDDSNHDWSLLRHFGQWSVFTGENGVLTGVATQTNVWQHVAATWTPGEGVRLYLNGVEAFFTSEISYDTSDAAIGIGENPWPTWVENFDGDIDEVRIYVRPLSGTEIQAIYQEESP